jgi:hypothetical protein
LQLNFSINKTTRFQSSSSQSGEPSNQNQRIKNYDTQLDKNLFTISSKTNCFHFLMFWIEYWYSGLIFALLYWNDERYDWNRKDNVHQVLVELTGMPVFQIVLYS